MESSAGIRAAGSWCRMPKPEYLMYVCDHCGDYSYPSGEASCSQEGCAGTMRRATPEQECDGCANQHRTDFAHTCQKIS